MRRCLVKVVLPEHDGPPIPTTLTFSGMVSVAVEPSLTRSGQGLLL